MTSAPSNQYLPPWATEDPAHFERYGLLAERRSDGLTTCNIEIVGGVAGQPVPPEWGEPTAPRFLLALSVVLRMMTCPDEMSAPMAPYVTQRFRGLTRGTTTLDDGTITTPWLNRLARMFEAQYLCETADPNSLTVPAETIIKSLRIYLNELYPDTPAKAQS